MSHQVTSHLLYAPGYAAEAREMVGATDVELADHFGVSIANVQLWVVCHPEFAAAIKVARAEADDRVERALYSRAVGYTFDSEKIITGSITTEHDDQTVTEPHVTRIPIREHVPPDVSACGLWLRNRRPETWNERRDVNVHSTVTVTHRDLTGLPLDEIQREYAETLDLVAEVQPLAAPEGDRA